MSLRYLSFSGCATSTFILKMLYFVILLGSYLTFPMYSIWEYSAGGGVVGGEGGSKPFFFFPQKSQLFPDHFSVIYFSLWVLNTPF